MKKLNFPVIKNIAGAAKVLPMDEYLKFVLFNIKYTADLEAIRGQKKKAAVNFRFKLK